MVKLKATAVYVLVLCVGGILGGVVGSYVSASKDERNFRHLHDYATFVRAKERATLLRLLEKDSIAEARNVLYVVLAGDFDDYGRADSSTNKACELLEVLGLSALANKPELVGDHDKSHRYLVKSVRAATVSCKSAEK